jgi:hypothetical protein
MSTSTNQLDLTPLPAAFDNPIKVKEYLKFSWDEIYDEIL